MFERMTRDQRATLMLGYDEAADLGAREFGPEHLLLGMLCNARSDGHRILTGAGLTLDAAREAARGAAGSGEEADDQRSYDRHREALASIGIDLEKVREAVLAGFGGRPEADLRRGWQGRRGPGRGRRGGPHRRPPFVDARCEAGEFAGEQGVPGRGRFGDGGPFGDGERQGPPPGLYIAGWGDRRGRGGRGGRPRFSAAMRTVLERTVTDLRTAGERDITDAALLRGILDVADPAAVAVIESGTTVDELRTLLDASDQRDV